MYLQELSESYLLRETSELNVQKCIDVNLASDTI